MLSLDFYKAFDSVEWNYLSKVLHKMEVPVSFIKWVKLIYNSNTSYVINKGELSEPVELSRGLFQGSQAQSTPLFGCYRAIGGGYSLLHRYRGYLLLHPY